MSKQSKTLDIELSIASRLWYTSSVIISCTNVNVNNITELESLIRSAIVSQNDRQYHWTSHKLLSKIIKSKYTGGECDIEAELVTIQFNNALKLTCCVPKYLEENPLSLLNIRSLTDTDCKQTIDFIINNFQENPDILCWILNHLYAVQCNNGPKAVNSFKTLCISALKEFVRDSSAESLNKPCTGNKNCYDHKFIGKLMCILAKLDILEYDESERLTWLYPTLFEICDVRDVEFALYARNEQKLLNEWLSYVNEFFGRSIDPNTLTNAVKICKAILKSQTNASSQLYAEELLFRIIERKHHWLLDILDLCCTLAINKDYDNVQLFMQQLSHGCLWPSLLLKVLQDCLKDDNGLLKKWEDNILMCDVLKHLLDMCNFESWHNSSLSELDATLRNHIKVIEWILVHAKTGSSTENNSSVQVRSPIIKPVVTVKYILQILQNFSTLAALKKTIDIHEANYDDIQHLLTNVSQERNTFLAYCSLAVSVKAILLCEYYDTECIRVTECFQEVESYLQALFPLSIRLETIENIFCLLFLRQEHFDDRTRFSEGNNIDTSNEYSDIESTSTEHSCMGFICNKYAVREVLYHLQNFMLTADTDYTREKENGLIQNLDEIQNKIYAITQRIADANWRLELCTNTTFIKNVGIFDGMHKNSDLTRKHMNNTSDKAGFPHSSKTSTPFYEEDDSSTYESKKRSDSSSDTTFAYSSGRPRKRTRNTASASEFLTLRDNSQRSSFINFMLASNESLVLLCLQKGRFEKAEEVIEVADMKNSHLDEKVRFSKAMQLFRQSLFKDADELDNTGETKGSPKISTLESIRLAAQEGIQSSRHTNQLETFLASQETHLRAFTSDGTQNNETLALSALDLALTMSRTHKIANSFCDVAMKHLKLCNSLENTEHAHFFSKICQLMNENKKVTVTDILCDAQIPLSIKEWEEKGEFWNELTTACKEFCECNNVNNNVDDTAINATYLRESKILRKITSICGNKEKYLQNIYSHLQLLHTIIPTSFDGTQTFTMSNTLKIPLHYFFGHQLFELCIEPHKLETIANNLQVNLVHTILTNTCPNIPCCNNSLYITKKSYTGCVILNENCYDTPALENNTSDSPNQCIARILEELLQILHCLSEDKPILTRTDLKSFAENSNMQAALNKTSRLTSLDLSELSVGNETMAFFINLWNVMYIHAAVTVWSNDTSCNCLNHNISLMSTGYIVGDLGLVTLAALRAKLLDGLVPVSKYFNQIEELNEAAWQDLDLVQNPKVLFVMAHEFCKTPRIRVLDAKALDHDLDEAVRDYMNHYTSQFTNTDVNNKLCKDVIESLHNLSAKGRLNINSENLINDEENAKSSKALLISIENILVEYKNLDISCLVALNYTNNINVQSLREANSTVTTYGQNRVIKENLLQYLEGHCWLLSYLVQRMYNKHSVEVSGTDDRLKRTACLENLLTSPWVNTLKLFFDNNETLTGINDLIPAKNLWQYFENALENDKWSQCLDIVNALPDNMLMESFQIQYFRDKLLSHLIANCTNLLTDRLLQLLYQIKDVHILTQTILSNISDWHINVCEFALLHALRHKDNKTLPSHCKFNMKEILRRVTIFRQMLPYCTDRCNGTWYDVAYCTQKIDPFCVIKSLINADKFELCLEWLECQAFSQKVQSSVTQEFLIGLLKTEEDDFKCTSKLLQALPLSQSLKMCKGALKKLEAPNVLQFVANYLLQHCKVTGTAKYRRTLVGIEILKHLDLKERMLYIHLIKEPLLMLEQLLMNCKFETIQRILNVSREIMEQADISLSSFDETIIFYAKKSLDFRVCLQRDGTDTKSKIVQQSTSVEPESNEFVMPVSTPTKEKWVPNDKARECSCCKAVIFSMFNRRHHCRRCGRVVCAVCSQHRMQVSGYPSSVLVRVCDDCKRQTAAQMRAAHGVPSTPSSETFDYWRLTRDEAHDRTIREEFSFEYAPSISLCLSILNLHSDHKAYTNVLLDRCDEMKCLLRPVSNGKVNPEVDHAVIIKMIRSLLVAAKVKCAKLGFNTGLTHCDRFLSQVDLIATLARSDCLDFIPSGDLDDRALRKLRDLLTEKEEWTLALDVSTKSGLDTTLGVWAAWGKACLKVGSFEQARDKFLHCLDKISDDDFDDWVLLSYPKDSAATESCASPAYSYKDTTNETQQGEKQTEPPTSKRSEPVRSRPAKDPPLLTEILQILENLSVNSHFIQQNPYDKNKPVYEISNIVNNLKAISLGHFATKVTNPTTQTVYQQESLYYLLTYGSYNSILGHFIKYEEFEKCLAFVLENDLDPEIFFNGIYINSLKNGSNSKLCEAMKKKDPLLLMWRKYLIHICHNLERRQYLHCLYQLQLFMKDSVRAAMTCIRFYVNDTSTYTNLCSRAQFLLDAQAHLESELQVSTLTRKRRKSTGSAHSNSQSILTMEMEPCEIDRHINTISRQMEIAKFLGNAEKEGRMPSQFLNIFPDIDSDKSHNLEMPTLFGNQQEKIHLAVLAILCGRNVEEGFGIAFRIMQDYNLPSQKVYSLAGHALAVQSNIAAIEQLIKCCRSSGAPGSNKISDYVLTHCVKLLLNRLYDESESVQKNQIDILIRLITDIELKIIAYIDSKQLKAAYLLAVKYSRTQDVRKILKESDRLGQQAIKTICMKWLQQQAKR